MPTDPITSIVKQALAQGFRRDDLLLILADPSSEAGARLREQGMQEVSGVIIAVIPTRNFGTAFPDAPNKVRDALLDKPAKGALHALQIDERGEWGLGSFSVAE